MEELIKEFNNKKSLIVGDVFLIHQIFESIEKNKFEPLKENKNGIFELINSKCIISSNSRSG